MLSWVIGSGGLLGSALCRIVGGEQFAGPRVPWCSLQDSIDVLLSSLHAFSERVRSQPSARWRIYWAAGAAVVASDPTAVSSEVETFRKFMSRIPELLPGEGGSFFLASSAGGVYAGGRGAPFDEYSTVKPLSAYGNGKLQMELITEEKLTNRVPFIIGRIANLYGPGQNIAKQHGLVFSLCRAAATRQPLSIYVPMETLRDYLYVDDAALAVRSFTLAAPPEGKTVVIASGQSTSIMELVALTERVTHRRIPISKGLDSSAVFQAVDLRLVATEVPDQISWPRTDLSTGIRRTFNAVIQQPVARHL